MATSDFDYVLAKSSVPMRFIKKSRKVRKDVRENDSEPMRI